MSCLWLVYRCGSERYLGRVGVPRFARRLLVTAAVIGCAVCAAAPANATFPGENGKIVFSKGGDLWTINPDGSELTQLTSGDRNDWRPKWAPDGSMIAFNGDDCNPCEGWLRGYDGFGAYLRRADASITRIGNDQADYSDVAWAPDRRVVFSTEKGAPFIDIPGQFVNVVVANADGSDRRVITGSLDPAEPDWSPAADELAILRHYDGSVIYFVDPAGNTTYFNDPSSNEIPNSYSPSWSPDGTHLAWVGGSGSTANNCNGQCVYTAKPDATDFQQINLDGSSFATSVAWSPDGSQFVFTRHAGIPSPPEVWLMNANGTDAHFLTEGAAPDWQPRVPPHILGSPRVSGVAREGQTLTARRGYWFATPEVDYAYQWSLCDTAGENCADIAGATEQTYTLPEDAVMHTLQVTVTATNDLGQSSAQSGASPLVGAVIVGSAASDTLHGTPGADLAKGFGGDDVLGLGLGSDLGRGGPGNDLLVGRDGADALAGGPGRDRLRGGSGRDSLLGGAGADVLMGSAGHDGLRGGSGPDRISARDGVRDVITCGRGRDLVIADRRDSVARSCETVRLR